MAMSTRPPDMLATLVARLEDRYFSIVSDERRDGFGDRVITLSTPPIAVRIVGDRDQWFVELAHEEWDDWFDPDLWRACLDDIAVPDEPRPLVEQSRFVVSELGRIIAIGSAEPGRLLSCLGETRAARSRRRIGFDE
jgi:hypothetical protein